MTNEANSELSGKPIKGISALIEHFEMQGIRDPEIRKMMHARTRGLGRIFIASTGGEYPWKLGERIMGEPEWI